MKLVSPYDNGAVGTWYRGNLHTHTTESDGRLAPVAVCDLYRDHGYDFLCVSDHDMYTRCEPCDDLVLVPGVEVTRGGPHLLAVGVGKFYDTERPRPDIVAEILADGALCVLNHPNWGPTFNHWDQSELEAIEGYHGIEVFNSVIDFLAGEAFAADRWDMLLAKGRRVWGFANDDMHYGHDAARGWNMVLASEPTPAALVEAMKQGRFYASTGVTIEAIEVSGDTITVRAPDASDIRFIIRSGIMKQCSDGPTASYTVAGNEGYVRVECLGRGRRVAFTQPFFIEE